MLSCQFARGREVLDPNRSQAHPALTTAHPTLEPSVSRPGLVLRAELYSPGGREDAQVPPWDRTRTRPGALPSPLSLCPCPRLLPPRRMCATPTRGKTGAWRLGCTRDPLHSRLRYTGRVVSSSVPQFPQQ